MRAYPFKQVDVFTTRPCAGNPVAVVLAADGLDAVEMQRVASWTNLSETTFVLTPTSPEADYRLRIFSPGHELRFAGHPTVGSAHAALEASVVRSVIPSGVRRRRLAAQGDAQRSRTVHRRHGAGGEVRARLRRSG